MAIGASAVSAPLAWKVERKRQVERLPTDNLGRGGQDDARREQIDRADLILGTEDAPCMIHADGIKPRKLVVVRPSLLSQCQIAPRQRWIESTGRRRRRRACPSSI